MRRGTGSLYRRAQSVRFLFGRDRAAVHAFLRARYPVALSLRERLPLLARFVATTNHVRTYHTQAEMLAVADRILRLAGRPGLTVIEAGSGKGGSTAKLSLVARLAGGRLLVFDSFRGIPPNTERHRTIWGRPVEFRAGAFRGRLPSVRRTVARFGAPEVCEFRKGWFADTMPALDRPVDIALLDVDLLSSTRTCLTHLMPRLRPGGGDLHPGRPPGGDRRAAGRPRFWRDEFGVEPPRITGLGARKLLAIPAPREPRVGATASGRPVTLRPPLALAQLDAADLAAHRLRQRVDELDLARVLVRRGHALHVLLQLLRQRVARRVARRAGRRTPSRSRRASASGLATTADSTTAGCSSSALSTSNGPMR